MTPSQKHAAAEVDHASARSQRILPSEDGHEPQAQQALAPMRRDEGTHDADARGPESRGLDGAAAWWEGSNTFPRRSRTCGQLNRQTISKILCANLLRSSSTPLDDGFDGATADGELEAPGPMNEKFAAYLDGPVSRRTPRARHRTQELILYRHDGSVQSGGVVTGVYTWK